MEQESVVKLGLRCADRQIAASDFLTLYREFYNDKVTNKLESGNSPNDNTELSDISNKLALNFVELLKSQDQLILADYAVEVLFVNYNSNLVRCFLPHVYSIENMPLLKHLLSRTCAFFANLSDTIIIDQVCGDMADCILPNILNVDINSIDDDLVVTISKLLQVVLKCVTNNLSISSENLRESLYALTSRLSKINKLLFKRLNQTIDVKLLFKDSKVNFNKDLVHEVINSPSITSPQFIPSPMATMKNATSKGNSSLKYQDMKLLRYFKNIWLNNQILDWETNNPDFLSRYASIASSVFEDSHILSQPPDLAIADLIETSFTCFAQFVSNKQYHQANAFFNLLERQWVLFITKQLPLLVLQHAPESQRLILSTIENIDDKVVKSIRTYYSEKDDMKSRNEDLFDNYPSATLDIRHDFIKSLVRMNLQPPDIIMKFLREDQVIDVKTLPVTNELVVKNGQGVQEVVRDIRMFILTSLDSLETDLFGNTNSEHTDGLQQILKDFENISPIKQRELSNCIIKILDDATRDLNFNHIIKICALLAFNFSHSLTSILSFVTPNKVCEMLMRFVDITWQTSVEAKRRELGDSEFETMNIFLSFSWSILLLIVISDTYNISLIDVALKSNELKTKNSYTLLFTSKLSEIPDVFMLDTQDPGDKNMQMKSQDMVESWLKDLFVNGSISDSLLQNVDAKQLSQLVPFIFKQILLSLEIGSVDTVSNLTGGLEYFLQPFMLVGLIKIVHWLEQYLCSLRSDMISDAQLEKVFIVLNSIINPSTLNEDSASFHNAVLRLNAIKMLKILRQFRIQSQSNYGIYSSEATGNPKLEALIKKMLTVLQISPNYNMDPRILNTENDYPQKHLGYNGFLILNETPINKIMTNQINSFWNLHSSTYYNLDYLNEIIDLVTPRHFLTDVFRTLEYKLATYGVPGTRNKNSSVESESVIEYFIYFLVLHDVRSSVDTKQLLLLLENDNSLENPIDNINIKSENTPKQEVTQDDDFDMLFGENDTSIQGVDEEPLIPALENEEGDRKKIAVLFRDSFGLILHEMKASNDMAIGSGTVNKERYERICKYHKKYLVILRKCTF